MNMGLTTSFQSNVLIPLGIKPTERLQDQVVILFFAFEFHTIFQKGTIFHAHQLCTGIPFLHVFNNSDDYLFKDYLFIYLGSVTERSKS